MKKIFNLLLLSTLSIATFAQSSYISGYPAGGLKLTGSLSSTLQRVKDKAGNNSILSISTQRIALGTATGTGLINLPDSTNAANGIQFGTGTSNLYRYSPNTIRTDGNFACGSFTSTNANAIINFNNNTGVTINPNSLTGSSATSALSITQTWNTTGNPPLIFANVTNTASGASANLMDLQVGGVSMFKVSKAGGVQAPVINATQYYSVNNSLIIGNGGLNRMYVGNSINSNISIHPVGIAFSSSGYATPNGSAVVDIQSTTQGFLPPRMTTTQKNAISSPANGLTVFDITLNQMSYWNGTTWINF